MKPDYSAKLFSLLFLISGTASAMIACWWVCDDAYISFRYARNLARGDGLTYNPTLLEPVEGYSNLLWVLLAAIPEYFAVPPDLVMPALSLLCGLLLTVRIFQVLTNELKHSTWNAACLTATTSLSPPFLIWATGGLATLPFALCIFLVFEGIFFRRPAALTPLALVTLCLIRAEGFAWALTLCGLGLLFAREKRPILTRLLPVIVITMAGLFLWRYLYYGALMPNTAAAKVGFSVERLLRGFDYVAVYILTFLAPLVAACVIFRLPSLLQRRSILAAALLYAGFFAYSILVGGDYMSMGRFLVPALAFQALLIGFLLPTSSAAITPLVCTLLIILSALPLAEIHLVPQSLRARFHFRLNRSKFIEERQHWEFMKRNSGRWRREGKRLKKHSKPGDSVVEGAIGNVGYFSERIIFDRMGLVTRIPASASPDTLRSPGHDVRVPELFFLPQKPTFLFVKSMGDAGLANLARQQDRYPYPYAPVVIDTHTDVRNHYFVLMKRQPDRESYANAWSALKE